jgi:hypothetical protein
MGNVADLPPDAPEYVRRVNDSLRRNATRFDGRTDLIGDRARNYILGMRSYLSPHPDGMYATPREVAVQIALLRFATVRGLKRMAHVNPRTRGGVVAAIATIRGLHDQFLFALETD